MWLRISYKQILDNHVKAVHLKVKDYNCDECEYAKRLSAKHLTREILFPSTL